MDKKSALAYCYWSIYRSFVKLSLVFVLASSAFHNTLAHDCTGIPSNNFTEAQLQIMLDSIGGEGAETITVESGPNFTCLVQGTIKGTYQELSVMMSYFYADALNMETTVGQFEMDCVSYGGTTDWDSRPGSLVMVSGSNQDSIGLWKNCSSCTANAGNRNHCQACDSSCNTGLMRCTGSSSADCCVAFEDDLQCSPDLSCNKYNLVANMQNNFTCAELADISVNLRPTVTPAKLCYVENPGCHQCDLSHCCTVCYQGYNLDEYMCKTDTTMPWPAIIGGVCSAVVAMGVILATVVAVAGIYCAKKKANRVKTGLQQQDAMSSIKTKRNPVYGWRNQRGGSPLGENPHRPHRNSPIALHDTSIAAEDSIQIEENLAYSRQNQNSFSSNSWNQTHYEKIQAATATVEPTTHRSTDSILAEKNPAYGKHHRSSPHLNNNGHEVNDNEQMPTNLSIHTDKNPAYQLNNKDFIQTNPAYGKRPHSCSVITAAFTSED